MTKAVVKVVSRRRRNFLFGWCNPEIGFAATYLLPLRSFYTLPPGRGVSARYALGLGKRDDFFTFIFLLSHLDARLIMPGLSSYPDIFVSFFFRNDTTSMMFCIIDREPFIGKSNYLLGTCICYTWPFLFPWSVILPLFFFRMYT